MDLYTLAYFGLALTLIGAVWSRWSERRSTGRHTGLEQEPGRASAVGVPLQPAGITHAELARVEVSRRSGAAVRPAPNHLAPAAELRELLHVTRGGETQGVERQAR